MPDTVENNLSRLMPYDKNAEGAVIGAMLLDQDAIPKAQEVLNSADFYLKQYAYVFDALCDLYNEGKPTELPLVHDKLVKMEVDPGISNMTFLQEAYDASVTSASVLEYAELVKEKSTLRQIIRICQASQEKCFKAVEPVADIMEFTERNVFELTDDQNAREYVKISDVVIDAINRLEKTAKNKGQITGIPTGFKDLDRMLNGLQNSDLVLIAARPSMGKTAFALNIAQHASLRKDKAVAIFSLEMSKEQLVNRLLALEGQVEGTRLRSGELTDDDWSRIVMSSTTIGGSKLILDDTPGLSPSLLRSKCRKYKAMYGLDMIIIDYLQLMEGDLKGGRRVENKQQEISDISRSLKLIARELNVPVIALSQLSRAVEARTDHHPQLSDLRESGAIEQDADVVMFLYREWVYDKENGNRNAAEVMVAKQRNGPIGNVRLTWLENYTKFADAANNYDKGE